MSYFRRTSSVNVPSPRRRSTMGRFTCELPPTSGGSATRPSEQSAHFTPLAAKWADPSFGPIGSLEHLRETRFGVPKFDPFVTSQSPALLKASRFQDERAPKLLEFAPHAERSKNPPRGGSRFGRVFRPAVCSVQRRPVHPNAEDDTR